MPKGVIHGHAYERTYSVWIMMLNRCENPNSDKATHYHDRGIRTALEMAR